MFDRNELVELEIKNIQDHLTDAEIARAEQLYKEMEAVNKKKSIVAVLFFIVAFPVGIFVAFISDSEGLGLSAGLSSFAFALYYGNAVVPLYEKGRIVREAQKRVKETREKDQHYRRSPGLILPDDVKLQLPDFLVERMEMGKLDDEKRMVYVKKNLHEILERATEIEEVYSNITKGLKELDQAWVNAHSKEDGVLETLAIHYFTFRMKEQVQGVLPVFKETAEELRKDLVLARQLEKAGFDTATHERHIKVILPLPIYDRLKKGKLSTYTEQHRAYTQANRDYIQSLSGKITQWHEEGFEVTGALQKAISDGLLSKPHHIDIVELQAAVNETIDELWRDLNQAQRKESKRQPSRGEDIEAKDKYEDLIQQKLLKWRERNAPTMDLSRCALLSLWQDDWKEGREPAEYLPVFEAYQEFENRLRNPSA